MSGEAFSFAVPIARIPPGGKHFRVAPNEQERRAVAAALGIVDLAALTAELEVRPVGAEAFAVNGRLSASVVQTDVVTLEPLRQQVSEAIELTLLPAEDAAAKERVSQSGLDAPADRDVYRGGRIDLGAIVVEHLALGLDPYPRSPGVEFPGHIEADPGAESSPFAALAKLKRNQD